MDITVTADHIRELHGARFSDEAVLVIDEGELHIWSRSTATDHRAEIITTATDVHEHCEGEMSDALATQLAADLNAERAGTL